MNPTLPSWPLLSDFDIHLLAEGRHERLWTRLGAHACHRDGQEGFGFAVWAPNARRMAVIGEFNGWNPDTHLMDHVGGGFWTTFVPGARHGQTYKFHLVSRVRNYWVEKADPVAAWSEIRPGSASRLHGPSTHAWKDGEWMERRKQSNPWMEPMSIYEVHLGSWQRVPEEGDRFLSYRELAPRLAGHCRRMGFTHVELLPVSEHPFDASWGYQVTGYFAPTSRHGTPDDFRFLVDTLHQAGIGVFLDWVPAHFPRDFPGLSFFDGTSLYEHADPRLGEHKDWSTLIFNFGRLEVANFLLANVLYWIEEFHLDGLRVDAVASMLYLDYSRKPGEWIPNRYGGRENLDAINFLRRLNERVHALHPGVVTIAEESTAWSGVSRPVEYGGLGFGFKWDMGWMHDSLAFMGRNAVHRRWHQNDLTFRGLYQHSENYVLPLSHDEVVHGKGSLLGRMPGDLWQKFANLRLLLGWQAAQPGKKLLFMGGEFGQFREWSEARSLDWHLMDFPLHRGLSELVADLNRLHIDLPCMHRRDCCPGGMHMIDCTDAEQNILSFLRQGDRDNEVALWVFNFTPVPRHPYRVGVPRGGFWKEMLCSDASRYGGSDAGNWGGHHAEAVGWQGMPFSIQVRMPPLGFSVFVPAD